LHPVVDDGSTCQALPSSDVRQIRIRDPRPPQGDRRRGGLRARRGSVRGGRASCGAPGRTGSARNG